MASIISFEEELKYPQQKKPRRALLRRRGYIPFFVHREAMGVSLILAAVMAVLASS